MMRMITAAWLLVLLIASLFIRTDDDLSWVKDLLSANHCFDRKYFVGYPYRDGSRGGLSNRL
jgi:hypothetical protein